MLGIYHTIRMAISDWGKGKGGGVTYLPYISKQIYTKDFNKRLPTIETLASSSVISTEFKKIKDQVVYLLCNRKRLLFIILNSLHVIYCNRDMNENCVHKLGQVNNKIKKKKKQLGAFVMNFSNVLQ